MYTFGNTEYTQESLSAMSIEDLTTLRNDVAEKLGHKPIKTFKSQEAAVAAVVKAFEKLADKDSKDRAQIAKKEKEPRPIPKCARPMVVERPTRAMFRTIRKLCDHPGEGYRIGRWENYRDGMTMLDIMEGDNMSHQDIGYYVTHKLMELKDPTDEQYEHGMAAWAKRHGIENPLDAKKRAAEAKEEKEAA